MNEVDGTLAPALSVQLGCIWGGSRALYIALSLCAFHRGGGAAERRVLCFVFCVCIQLLSEMDVEKEQREGGGKGGGDEERKRRITSSLVDGDRDRSEDGVLLWFWLL